MAGESALYKKFRAEQDAADAAYKSWEKDQWEKNGAEWTKQGYTRTEDPSNLWGSKWSYNPTGNSSASNGGSSGGNGGSGASSGTGADAGSGSGAGSAIKVEDYSDLASSIQTTINNAKNMPSYTVGSDLFGTKNNTPWGGNVSELVRKNAQDRLNNEERLNSYNFSSGKDYLSEADLRNHFHREFADNLKNKGVKLVTNYQGGLDADWLRKQADYDALYQRYKSNNTITTIGDHVGNFFGGIGDWFNKKSAGTVNRNVNPHAFKQGGTMNKVKYFSQGGAPTQTTQNQMSPEQELKAAAQFLQAVQAGDKKAVASLQQIQEAAQKGVPEAQRMMKLLEQASKMLKSAKWGSKLEYIRSLKFGKGGKHICPACEQQKVEIKKCGGKKAKKHFFGGGFDVNEKNPMRMSNGTNVVGIVNRERFKNSSTRGLSQTIYDSTGRPVVQKDKTSNGGEREIYYNTVRTPIKRKGLFSPGHVMTNDTVYISGTPEMFENAPNMSTPEKKNQAYRFAQGMD